MLFRKSNATCGEGSMTCIYDMHDARCSAAAQGEGWKFTPKCYSCLWRPCPRTTHHTGQNISEPRTPLLQLVSLIQQRQCSEQPSDGRYSLLKRTNGESKDVARGAQGDGGAQHFGRQRTMRAHGMGVYPIA